MMLMTACGQKGDLYLPNIPPAPNVMAEQFGPSEAVEGLQEPLIETDLEGDQAEHAETVKDEKTPESDKSMSETAAD